MPLFGLGRRRAVTSSAARVKRKNADEIQRLHQSWQAQAFHYYDSIGEVWFAAQFYSRMLSPLRLYAGEIDDNGEVKASENPKAQQLVSRIQDPGGGQSGWLGAYGRLRFLAGECYLLWTAAEGDEPEKWEVVSTDELRVNPGGATYSRVAAPSLAVEELNALPDDAFEPLANTAIPYRLWRRHPRFSQLADSPMRSVLEICEELLILTRAVRGRARSRAAGPGLLLIPTEISAKPPAPTTDEDIVEDPFYRDLIEALIKPIEDEGVAAAHVPMLVRGEAEYLDAIRHIQLHDPMQSYPETGLREECVRRLALGLDFPPEELLGISDANHWSGWQISEQAWLAHGKPLARELMDDLTSVYLRPNAREQQIPEWERLVVAYDEAAVTTNPDQGKDAKDLHKLGAIGDSALRRAANFNDDDAQTPEERQVWLGVALRDSTLAMTGLPSSRTEGAGELPAAEDVGASPNEVDREPPPDPDREGPAAVTGGARSRAVSETRVLTAADLGLVRARELAGNRVRSHAKRDDVTLERINGASASVVASTLGKEACRRVTGMTEAKLVAGSEPLIRDALALWGIRNDELAKFVVAQVEQYAALTLYQERPAPFPASFTNHLRSMMQG